MISPISEIYYTVNFALTEIHFQSVNQNILILLPFLTRNCRTISALNVATWHDPLLSTIDGQSVRPIALRRTDESTKFTD